MAQPVTLVLKYDRKVGRWLIKTVRGMEDPLIQFPSEKRVEELWDKYVPGKHGILLGSSIAQPVRGFYADLDSTSTKAQRRKFVEALSAEAKYV
jgi:hypothetical protein